MDQETCCVCFVLCLSNTVFLAHFAEYNAVTFFWFFGYVIYNTSIYAHTVEIVFVN